MEMQPLGNQTQLNVNNLTQYIQGGHCRATVTICLFLRIYIDAWNSSESEVVQDFKQKKSVFSRLLFARSRGYH
jgi:hypothetical protein